MTHRHLYRAGLAALPGCVASRALARLPSSAGNPSVEQSIAKGRWQALSVECQQPGDAAPPLNVVNGSGRHFFQLTYKAEGSARVQKHPHSARRCSRFG